jgi:hypothetical protein
MLTAAAYRLYKKGGEPAGCAGVFGKTAGGGAGLFGFCSICFYG